MNEPAPKRSLQEFYARALVRERTRASMTQAELGAHPAVMVSGQLIGHVENCRRAPTQRLSQGIDRALELEDYFEELYEHMVEESGIPSAFWEYSEQEALASSIRSYDNFLINGLLQTEEYAREIMRAGQRADRLDQLVAARMARQEALRWRNANARHPDVLAEQRREHARIRSERQQRWGRPRSRAA